MTELPKRQRNKQAKEKRILEAALKIFADLGYSGATMDAIAEAANLSKPTLYQYFESKEILFTAMMAAKKGDMLVAFEHPRAEALVKQLHSFAWEYADTIMRRDLLSLARLIIGEAQRFPSVGRAYQASGPDQVLKGIIAYLETQRSMGRLEFCDSELAAQDLWGLILSGPRNQALHQPDALPDRATLERYINNGLMVFLKAYSTDVARDLSKLATIIEKQETLETRN